MISVKETLQRIMLIIIALFVFLLFIDPLGAQLNVFVVKTKDLFADFFNVMIYISGDDPYFHPLNGPEQKPYFPLAYVIMSLFSGFEDYSSLSLQDCYQSTTAMISCVLFTLGSIALFFHSLSRIIKLDTAIIIIVCLSSIFLHTIERGNLIVISASMAFYFIAYKDNQNPYLRYLALIALCISVVLKGFPIVLGLFLLQEKRYKDIVFCMLVGAVLTFVPYLFFEHGFVNIPQHLYNVKMNGIMAEGLVLPRFGLTFIPNFIVNHIPHSLYVILFAIGKYFVWILSALSICFFFRESVLWKKVALLSFIIAFFPTSNWFYCGLFFFPFIIMFLQDNEGRKVDYLYAILICIFLNPLQIVLRSIPISWVFSNLAMLMLWIALLYESGKKFLILRKIDDKESDLR